MPQACEAVRCEVSDGIARVTLDDGKANALSPAVLDGLQWAFDRAEREANAVLLIGRERRLSAGFDLSVMLTGPEHARSLVMAGAETLLRLYTFPLPVVIACSGHALAAGAILLLVGDVRVGALGEFKIGLNEVSIQMTLPVFAMELARDRLSPRYLTAATTQARVFDPLGAANAGYLDELVEPGQVADRALEHARRLALLPQPAFRQTKLRERGASVARIRATLADDIATLTQPAAP